MSTVSRKANLVLIPSPVMGHLVPAIELAKQLVARDSRLVVTVFIIRLPVSDENLESHLVSVKSSITNQGIIFVDLPPLDASEYMEVQVDPRYKGPVFLTLYMESYRSKAKHAIEELLAAGPAPVLVGLVVSSFCSAMIEVANELELPSYVLYTSTARFLSMEFHLEELGVDLAEKYESQPLDTTLEFPGFKNPVPLKVLPGIILEKHGGSAYLRRHPMRYRQADGILINTFSELDWDVIRSMLMSVSQNNNNNRIPPIFPVGPILNLNLNHPVPDHHGHGHGHGGDDKNEDPIFSWLDAQPSGSVAFLCFGSRGCFNEEQVKEIAAGLEKSGRRFLWSLRMVQPLELDDLSTVLPEGFLERTLDIGRVIGWAPQARVLAHRAIGAFVSHCGWNSTLESLWFGVPMATWPLYAEQQFNAFMLVRELGLAAEIRMDYRQDLRHNMVVKAAEVEEGIRRVLDVNDQGAAALRNKVKEMSDKARKAKVDGGSSHESLGRFIEGVFQNLHSLEIC